MKDKKNQRERDNYANLTELGMCTHCRKQPAIEGKTSCYDCEELRKAKYFAPRTEETKSTLSVTPKERNTFLLNYLKGNKILFKLVDRFKSLYVTPRKVTFMLVTITLFKHSVTKGVTYRIRNETSTESDYYVALFPDEMSVYVIPNPKPSTIYFCKEEIEEYKYAISSL